MLVDISFALQYNVCNNMSNSMLIGAGNTPQVLMTVAVAVAIEEASK